MGWRQRSGLRTARHCHQYTKRTQLWPIETVAVLGSAARRSPFRENRRLASTQVSCRFLNSEEKSAGRRDNCLSAGVIPVVYSRPLAPEVLQSAKGERARHVRGTDARSPARDRTPSVHRRRGLYKIAGQ